MHKPILNLSKTLMAVALAGFATASLLTAADPPAAAPADRGRGGPDRRGIGLDDQQRQLYREALQKNQDAITKLDEKLRAAQKELVQAAIAEKFDEKLVAEKADAVAKIQAEMIVLRAKALSTVAPTLKPEQRQELENSRMGAFMLTSGWMDFGGGRGGGPGGDQGGPRGRDRGTDRGRPPGR